MKTRAILGSVFSVIFVFANFTSPVSAQASDVRIEDDFSLSYPNGKSEEILDYLKKRYIDDKGFITSLGPDFKAAYGDEDFTDTYFDTPNLDLAKRKIGLRHRRRTNRLDETNRKNGRELIQLKLSGDDKLADQGNQGSRNEIKFDVVPPITKIKSMEDNNPLLKLIDRKERDLLKATLQELGININDVKPIVTIEQHRRRVYINNNNGTLVSFSVDDAYSSAWLRKIAFSQMELELNELEYTEADEATRERMQEVRTTMIKDLRTEFPYLQNDTSIKYTKALDLLSHKIRWIKFWIKSGIFKGRAPVSQVET